MNKIKTALATVALVSSTGGLLASTGATANASSGISDVKTTTGSCTGQADFEYRLSDAGTNHTEQRVQFAIDSKKDNRYWTLRVYRNGHLVRTLHDTTGGQGNASFDAKIVADDDSKIKVYAKAGYGEHCQSTLRLDSASD